MSPRWQQTAGAMLVAFGLGTSIPFRAAAEVQAREPGAQGATLPPPATAAPLPAPGIQTALDDLNAWVTGKGGHLGAFLVDTGSGVVLGARNEHRAQNPASTQKILTAGASLDLLGPHHVFTTALHGEVRDGGVHGLVLTGNGDPSLDLAGLWRLGLALARQGVTRVEGDIAVDQSHFDAQWTPPGFEQQPNEWATFRAPVSAVALERNAVALNVVPGRAGEPARFWFEPDGFVSATGRVETRAGAGEAVRLTLEPAGGMLLARLGGWIGTDAPRLRALRRADDPRLLAGYGLRQVLLGSGIACPGAVVLGPVGAARRLTYLESAPLGVLVRELGKSSDNFTAEMLARAIAASAHPGPARSEDGARTILAWMRRVGAAEPDTRMVNGSGLFDTNRVSAWSLATVLRHAARDPRIAPEFVSQLAIGGVDGTLGARFRSRASGRVIRAKTGTLDRVTALAGYLLRDGDDPIAFALLVDGARAPHAEVRSRIDRVVDALAATPVAR